MHVCLGKESSWLGRQMKYPLRHGRPRLRIRSDEVSLAAFVAGAGPAERNLNARPVALCPVSLQGASGASQDSKAP